MEADVTIFRPYNFEIGQKIRIENSRRKGDWLVVGVADTTITLQCPVSKKEFEWTTFCYFTESKRQEWPMLS